MNKISKKYKVNYINAEKLANENFNYASKGEHFSEIGYKNLAELIVEKIN